MTFPLGVYLIRGEARESVTRAHRLLVGDCMERFGFPDPYAGLPVPPFGAAQTEESRRYGVFDLVSAQQWGYHRAPAARPVSRPPQPQLSSAEVLMLTGSSTPEAGHPAGGTTYEGVAVPAGGCLGEATRGLAGADGDLADGELVIRVRDAAWEQAMADPAVTGVIEHWAACMERKGFDRSQPIDDPKWDPDNPDAVFLGPSPTEEEIREAVADVECKRETNLVGVWHTVEVAYQEALIEQNVTALTEIGNANDAIVKAALDVIADR